MDNIRDNFPFFKKNKKLIYLDNAATAQKSSSCIKAIDNFYSYQTAPVHRGVYSLAENTTMQYETARECIAKFIGAQSQEIIFNSGTTAGINFIANSFVALNLSAGDEIVITELEHHSNILPWIKLSNELGFKLKYIPITTEGLFDLTDLDKIITKQTKFVSVALTSNVIGITHDLSAIINKAKSVGAKVLVDAAQTIAHEKIQLKQLGADFLVFSGHKLGGPTGVGVLFIANHLHDLIYPSKLGGGMVENVDYHSFTYSKSPQKFEAGTPPIAQAIGLAAAIEFLESLDRNKIKENEARLCKQLINGIEDLPINILGPIDIIKERGHIVSFTADNLHAHDIAQYLDRYSICVRAGNHCAQILHKKFNIYNSVRVSFFAYNTEQEVEQLIKHLRVLFCNKY